ncbi:hypothetical protein M433DRAFT_143215 [Acidomyces richmondensis BFW]|nr:hypothetical protein M433DRAFT_143215 [Acidomyces richmondensis BFW]
MPLVLVLAMAVSVGIGSYIEGGVAAGVLQINVVKTTVSLRSLSAPTANVIRDGNTFSVPTVEGVPGDLVEVKTEDTVPDELRIIYVAKFETDEALLTGESLPVRHAADKIFDTDTSPGDRQNVAYSSSSTVTKCRATGIVFVAGMYKERWPDGRAKLHRYVEAAMLMVPGAVGAFLGMISASLVVVLAITMAGGIKRMIDRHVVVRDLRRLEALERVTDICKDKTGTLTQGKMVAKKAWIPTLGTLTVSETDEPFNPTKGNISYSEREPKDNVNPDEERETYYEVLMRGNDALIRFLCVASLANLANVHQTEDGGWNACGGSTEITIQVFASRFQFNRRALMSGPQPSWKLLIVSNMDALAKLGLRVLALASKEYAERYHDGVEIDRNAVESNLIFHGLIGLYDPPRPESAPSVRSCHEAGIEVHMLTGDHPGTARVIAAQTDKLGEEVASSIIMTAAHLDALSSDAIDRLPVLPLVTSRCTPNTKGSDVAKEASDIILTDANFTSIRTAIEEGRRTFDNIQKFVLHLLAQNMAQAIILLVGLVIKNQENIFVCPLAPVEILWIIMIASGLPDIGLGFELAEADIRRSSPRNLKRSIFTPEIMVDMASIADGCNTMFRARATCFATLTLTSVFLAWESMDLKRSFFRMQPTAFVTISRLLYIPGLNDVVVKHPGITWEWSIVFIASMLFFFGVEGYNWGKRAFPRRMAKK